MRIAEAIAASTTRDVQIGPLHWRLGIVRSEDLIRQGVAMLSLLPSRIEGESSAAAEEAAKVLAGSPEAATKLAGLTDGLVCAAVRACSEDGATWEPIALVLEQRDEAPAEGRVWVASLPASIRRELYTAAMALNNDDGRLATALATFRGGSDGAAAGGPAGAEVRTDAA